MRFNILGSGSKGNATLVEFNNHLFLIDMGLTKTRLKEGTEYFNKSIDDIDVVLITHEHNDHIKGLSFIKDTSLIISGDNTLQDVLYKKINPYEEINIHDVNITALPLSHDAYNPLGYMLQYHNFKFVYITDTGYIDDKILSLINNPDVLLIESNHDKKMLLQSNRTLKLKKRILSSHGHLSNEECALYINKIIGKNTKEIILAHLSEECNTPELALLSNKKLKHKKICIRCAKQHENIEGYYED